MSLTSRDLLLSTAMLAAVKSVRERAERPTAPSPPFIRADFPGGNIVVDGIQGDTVKLHQDLRDTEGDWFYWYFAVEEAAGRTLDFEFTRGNVIGVRGPAISTDGGRIWNWLGMENVHGPAFRYSFPRNREEVRFCVAMPYVEANLLRFLKHFVNHPKLKIETLCHSQKGRKVELLRLGRLDGKVDHRVLLTARHHACETMANYSLEGILEAILANDEAGKWLQKHVEILVVPFMDKDGVEDGDQGKNRRPHDHNRDYSEGIYPSVRALRQLVPRWAEGRLRIALDMHCPGLRGFDHESILFVGGPNQDIWSHVLRFCQILESVQTGPLVYKSSSNLPFGKSWNKGPEGPNLKSFSGWASELPGIVIAATLEIPYANADGTEVTAQSAKALGEDIARALYGFLQEQTCRIPKEPER